MDISTQTLAIQAHAMAVLAKAAYLDDNSAFFKKWDLDTDYQALNNDDANGHIGSNDTQIIITIRGTEPSQINDLLADANAWPKTNGVGWVHSGFRAYARKLLPTILEYVAARPGRSIWVTGHSLGAAMALYITQELEWAGHSGITLFTFGCPRLGNANYIKQIKATHHRFVNCNDMVTRVPPTVLGYRHHGILHYIDVNGKLTQMTYTEWMLDVAKSIWDSWTHGVILDGLADHGMIEYVNHLANIDHID
jgi:triacylglycerol lipase